MGKVCIIAEAGVNHNGCLSLAKEMVIKACEAGADYIKFQTFVPKLLVSRNAPKADYQKKNTSEEQSQLQMLQNLSLEQTDYIDLKNYCSKTGIGFMSTPFDIDSIDFLNSLDLDFWKIPSGEITNLPYLIEIAKTHKPIILSTGMSTLDEVRAGYDVLKEYGASEITLLHCTTQYPTAYEEVNLRAMLSLQKEVGERVGYSDHTNGIEIPIAAVAMGATVIEKHFTLDRNMEGPDHKASLEPNELKQMIGAIRHIESAMGTGIKEPASTEIQNIAIARKSIVAKRDIKAGELLSVENITTKRPGNGISPMNWYEVLGTVAKRDFEEDELIEI